MMTIRVLDLNLELRRIIDVFSSFIWNEYYVGYGDFQLQFPMDDSALMFIQNGWYLSIAQSNKLMIIEKISIETDVQDGNYVVIEGRSLESLLLRRVLLETVTLTGSIQTSITRVINASFVNAASNRQVTRLVPAFTNDTAVTSLTTEAEYDRGTNVYDIINGLCDYLRLGYEVVPNYNDKSFEFRLYAGQDFSYDQNKKPWVVFSNKYENLKSSDMAIDTRDLRNVAIIMNDWSYQKVSHNDDGEEVTETVTGTLVEEVGTETGMERREILVEVNIPPDEVDKASFGTPQDRVNIRDYQEYMCLEFDSGGYNSAMKSYNSCVSNSTPTYSTVTKFVTVKEAADLAAKGNVITLDKGWVESTWQIGPDGSVKPPKGRSANAGIMTLGAVWGGSDSTASSGVKPDWLMPDKDRGMMKVQVGENPDAYERRCRRSARKCGSAPDRREYERWGWDFPSKAKEDAYNAAIKKAQEDIDNEYNAAVQAAINATRDQMRTEGLIALAEYLTISNFQAEVDPNVQFIYGRDYHMGDIVQIVNVYGYQAKTRVVGILFSEEEGEGVKVLPTFESDDPSDVSL